MVQGPEVFAFLLACLWNTYFKVETALLSANPAPRQDLKTVDNLQSAHSGACKSRVLKQDPVSRPLFLPASHPRENPQLLSLSRRVPGGRGQGKGSGSCLLQCLN